MAFLIKNARVKTQTREIAEKKKHVPKEPEKVHALLHVDPMELEVGYGLIRLVDQGQGGDLLNRITMIRRQVALELGLVVPPIRIRDNMQLDANHYVIKIKGVEVSSGDVHPGQYLAMDGGMQHPENSNSEINQHSQHPGCKKYHGHYNRKNLGNKSQCHFLDLSHCL